MPEMNEDQKLFERFLFEAPGDDPPDAQMADTGPPEMPDDAADAASPPDMPDLGGDETGGGDDGGPPDLGGDNDFGGFGGEEDGAADDGGEGGEDPNSLELDEKISAIMNMQLYQRYLSLLNTITGQLTTVKNNSDVLYSISPDSLDIIEQLKKLDENVRLYIKNSFLHENYSKNLLFFNKCLNLLQLLNVEFDKVIQKGIKSER